MRSVLQRKLSKPSKSGEAKQQFQELKTVPKAHSYQETTELRRIAVPDAQFGRNVNFVLHSNQMISDVFLEVTLGQADAAMNYCKDIGANILKSFELYYSGKEVSDCRDYQAELYELYTNQLACRSVDEQRREEWVRFLGGAASNAGRKVLVPLPCFWSSVWHDLKRKEVWKNGKGTNKLEFRFVFQPSSFCSAGHASNTIESCNIVYEEVILPNAVENAIVPANKKNQVRAEFHHGAKIACTSGTPLEIPLHSLLAYGNIKTLSFRIIPTAAVGAARDTLAVGGRCSTFKLEINGEEIEVLEDQLELDLEQWLQGFTFQRGQIANKPYRYSFALQPHQQNVIAGHLPSAFDQMTCTVTPTATGVLQVIGTIMKSWRWDGMGRLSRTD